MTEQETTDELLTIYVNEGSAIKLENAFSFGLLPSLNLDLILLAAQNLNENIGDGRIKVLSVLIRFLSQ
jgi:hypothetical protein